MKNKYIPFAVAESIYEIDIDFYKKLKVKILLMDLDNTLDSYRLYHPTAKAVALIESLREANIIPVIISNNRGKRVRTYATDLNVEYIHSAGKPFARKINKFIQAHGWNKEDILFIGDQMITDVAAANRAGLRVILTSKIVKEDQWTTRFNRIFGRMLRKYHKKKGHLIDWRTIYGKS